MRGVLSGSCRTKGSIARLSAASATLCYLGRGRIRLLPPPPMTNQKKRLLLPTTMAQPGWDLAKSRADVNAVAFPPGVTGGEFHRLLHDTDGIALTSTPLRAADIEAAPRLRAVARIGVGYDAVDVESLTRRGIPLMTCHTDNSPTVSEYAFYMMLHLAKGGAHMDSIPRQGSWPR